jgi:hypothetical protein
MPRDPSGRDLYIPLAPGGFMFKWILTGLFLLTGAFTVAWAQSTPQASGNPAGPNVGDWAFFKEAGVYKIKVIKQITPLYLHVSTRTVDNLKVLDATEQTSKILRKPLTDLSRDEKVKIVEEQLKEMEASGIKVTDELRTKVLAAMDAKTKVPDPVEVELAINNKTLKCQKHLSPSGKGPTVWICQAIYPDPSVKIEMDGKTDKVLLDWGVAGTTPDYSITKRLLPKTPETKTTPVQPKTGTTPVLPKKDAPVLPKPKPVLPKESKSPQKDK